MGALSMLMLVACGLVGVMSFAEIPALDDSTARAGGAQSICDCYPICTTDNYNNCMKTHAKTMAQGMWQYCLNAKVIAVFGSVSACIADKAVDFITSPGKDTCASILAEKTNRIGRGTDKGKCNKITDAETCKISYARLETVSGKNIIDVDSVSDGTFDAVFTCEWGENWKGEEVCKKATGAYQGCFQSAMMYAAMEDGAKAGEMMETMNDVLDGVALISETGAPAWVGSDL